MVKIFAKQILMTSSSKFSRRSFFKTGIAGALSSIIPLEYGYAKNNALESVTSPLGFDDNNWRKVRSEFIIKHGIAYMNNASLGMPPSIVVNAVRDLRARNFDVTILSPSSLEFEFDARRLDRTGYEVLKTERDILLSELRGLGAFVMDWEPDMLLNTALAGARGF